MSEEIRKHRKRKGEKFSISWFPYGFSKIYSRTKSHLKNRGYEFALSKRYVYHLHKQPCCYCGTLLSNCCEEKNRKYQYFYNGIDRIDNGKGYVEGNVQTCCFQCNRAKNHLTTDEFLAWIDKIYLAIHKDAVATR